MAEKNVLRQKDWRKEKNVEEKKKFMRKEKDGKVAMSIDELSKKKGRLEEELKKRRGRELRKERMKMLSEKWTSSSSSKYSCDTQVPE
ncbi:hypothetical protein BpHYR1_009168 [Brachionus plicatilis]|uniref:Uncharacterized protein n=1 Tax=Brachionus plicatilis TaxID=10195 RepID=A0A3M7R6R4_BRAPC|nr:hypothetical protein BpHYR1_009168 [Brachionus plicatilis]